MQHQEACLLSTVPTRTSSQLMSIICKASATHIITLMFGLGSLRYANGENKTLSLSPWPVLIDTGSSQNILKPSSWLQISCKCLHIFFSFFHDNNRKCSWETVPKTMTPDVATSMCFVIETQVTCCFSRVKSRKKNHIFIIPKFLQKI